MIMNTFMEPQLNSIHRQILYLELEIYPWFWTFPSSSEFNSEICVFLLEKNSTLITEAINIWNLAK